MGIYSYYIEGTTEQEKREALSAYKAVSSYYTLHIALKQHFSNMLYGGDATRIEYTTNGNALRQRSNRIQNFTDANNTIHAENEDIRSQDYLNFPFMNYKRGNYEFTDNPFRWNNTLQGSGVFIPEIGKKVLLNPVTFSFQGTVWLPSELDMVETQRRLRFDADNKTEIPYFLTTEDLDGNPCDLAMWSKLNYNSIDLDPEYQDDSWLEQNRIRTIGLSFSLDTFDAVIVPDEGFDNDLIDGYKPAGSFAITEEVLWNFKVQNALGNITYEETFQFLIDELS